ncbi:hypothetical protein MMC31_002896 [Peltigera leucophlebia]|nr:hypothetical protein [Peltigera leucophlebia]
MGSVQESSSSGNTTTTEQMKTDFFWGYDNSPGRALAKDHGLNSPQPIMCNTNESGGCLYMFLSGKNYYIWNQIESTVWRITAPLDLEGIVLKIGKVGVESLSIEEVLEV